MRRKKTISKYYYTNHKIRADKMRVIFGSENLGVITKSEALKIANENDLDLVLISPDANPPVAKILDFSKFLYQENKKKAQSKAKSKKSELKELKFGPTIDQGDLNQRVERAREFLTEGDRVRVTVRLRGRQNLFPNLAIEKLEKMTDEVSEVGKKESDIKHVGNQIILVLSPKKG